jgi:NADPH:quinone reductase-like Zn-dependent oxidoreductase
MLSSNPDLGKPGWRNDGGSCDRHEWLAGLGADELIDYTAVRFEEAVKDVDVVIDLVGAGHDNTSTRSLDVLRPGGLLVAIPSGVSPDLLDSAHARGLRATAFLVEPDGPALTRIGGLIDAGAVRVEVEEVFPLAQAARAHAYGETGRTRGKLVLRVAS